MAQSGAEKFGLAFGAFYVVLGIVGFTVTGFEGLTQNGPDKLLGISLNPFHNVAHLGIGLILIILCSVRNTPAAEGAVMGVGLFYIVAFVIGVTADDNLTILSVNGAGDPGNFFHLVSGVALLLVGLLSSAATASQAKKRGLT